MVAAGVLRLRTSDGSNTVWVCVGRALVGRNGTVAVTRTVDTVIVCCRVTNTRVGNGSGVTDTVSAGSVRTRGVAVSTAVTNFTGVSVAVRDGTTGTVSVTVGVMTPMVIVAVLTQSGTVGVRTAPSVPVTVGSCASMGQTVAVGVVVAVGVRVVRFFTAAAARFTADC